MTTSRPIPLALALAAAIAAGGASRAAAQGGPGPADPAAAGAAAPAPPPVVFFWSSGSAADAAAAATILPPIDQAARRRGAALVDLSPPADAPPALADQVARAVVAYDAMRFADAVFELDQAAAAAAEHGGRGLDRARLVDLFLYRALARSETGDQANAWADFVRAAALDPARVLDPARFRPSAVKSFTLALEEVKGRGTAALTVTAPAGSRIHIDGRAVGAGKVTETLQAGEHFVWVERPSGPPHARLVTLSGPVTLEVPEAPAAPPADPELRRRAARLGAGATFLLALRREAGVATVELRAIGPRTTALRAVAQLRPSPEAAARDLASALGRELARATRPASSGPALGSGPAGGGRADQTRWTRSRWLWLGVGAAAALLAVSPFLLDGDDDPTPVGAALDPGVLQP